MRHIIRSYGRKAVAAASPVAGILILAACEMATLPGPSDTLSSRTQEGVTAAPAEELAQQAETEETDADVPGPAATVKMLTFTDQESTFLSHVQNATQKWGEPVTRQYVELSSADGVTWQGERLAYADRDLWFLQQRAGDGSTAWQIATPSGAAPQDALPLLPQARVVQGVQPDVDIKFVRARLNGDGKWSFDVTVEHPDTGWSDYADGWQIESPEGEILGTRLLLHPHVGEQPFTRSLGGVDIPAEINEVRIRAHDLVSGYGPASVTLPLQEAGTGELYEVIR